MVGGELDRRCHVAARNGFIPGRGLLATVGICYFRDVSCEVRSSTIMLHIENSRDLARRGIRKLAVGLRRDNPFECHASVFHDDVNRRNRMCRVSEKR